MRLLAVLVLPFLLACASVVPVSPTGRGERALFVGNSLTYVGNVPAVFSALAEANGPPFPSDMIVRGGATLAQRVADGSVARALAGADYSALVLQERGGDLMCSSGPESCARSRQALHALVALAKAKGITVVLLGTYQPHPIASRRLVEAESAAAAQVGIPYLEVSEKLQRLRADAPDLVWFGSDGVHPGTDLALLNAMLVHQALRAVLPRPAPLAVDAPVYGISAGLTEALRAADAPPPRPDAPHGITYPQATMAVLLDFLARRPDRKEHTP